MLISMSFILSNSIFINSTFGFPFSSFITCAFCQLIPNRSGSKAETALYMASFAANLPA